MYFWEEGGAGEENQTMQVTKCTDIYFGFCRLTHDTTSALLLAFLESELFLSFDLQISSGYS